MTTEKIDTGTRSAPMRTLRAIPFALLLLAACGSDEPPPPQMPEFDPDRAWNYLGTQVTFGPRLAGHAPHDRQLAWMLDQLGFLADTAEAQYFTHHAGGERPIQFANVVARWRPELTDRVLLVTHWDTRQLADLDPDSTRRVYPVPGANEGASGTAVLMELAAMFHEQAPRVGVDMLFTDGFRRSADSTAVQLGAHHYVETLGDAPRPRFAIYVDRVGDLDVRVPREPQSSPEVVERIWSMARRMGRDSVFLERTGPAIGGDHTVLAAAGIPTAAVVDPEYGPQNRFWRTRSDHISNTDRESLARVGEVLAGVIYDLEPSAP